MANIVNTTSEYLDRQRVEIENLMPWEVGFPARADHLMMTQGGYCVDGGKYIYLPEKDEYQYKKGKFKITVEELIQQISSGNRGFVGTDGEGKHACFRINDLELYKTVFDLPDAKELPVQLTQEAIENLFKITTAKKFSEELEKLVVTDSEKKAFAYFTVYHPKLKELPLVILKSVENYTGISIYDVDQSE